MYIHIKMNNNVTLKDADMALLSIILSSYIIVTVSLYVFKSMKNKKSTIEIGTGTDVKPETNNTTNKLQNLLNGFIDNEDEPLLATDLKDYTPEENTSLQKDFKDIYNKMITIFWNATEVKLHEDKTHFESDKVGSNGRHALKFVISFFANADSIVADNIGFNFLSLIQPFYCKAGYRYIEMCEDIHAVTYNNIMLSLFPNEIDKIKSEIINISSIRRKIEFMSKWMSEDTTFDERVIAFLCVEALMFSSSFAIIFWFKTKSLMPGLLQANELIFRDEGLHQDFGVLVHKHIKNKTSPERIAEIIKEAVQIEINFVKEALPEPVQDLNSERISNYVRYVADRLANQLQIKKIYNVENPCNYMMQLGIEIKTNFFELNSTAYMTPSLADKKLKLVEDY